MDIYERLKAHAGGSEADEDSSLSNEHGERLNDSSESPFVIIQRGSKRLTQARNRKRSSEADAEDGAWTRRQETEFRRACFEEHVDTKDRRTTRRPTKITSSSSANNSRRDSQVDLETRAKVFDSVLGTVDRTIREQMQIADESVFQEIYLFSQRTMKRRTKEVDNLLPTGLVIGGGVSSADYSRVFPAMKQYLEEQGCRVALLGPNDLNGKTVSCTLEKILLQASRESEMDVLASGVCSMDDILGWHTSHMLGSPCPLIIIVESIEMSQARMLQDLIHVLHVHNQAIPLLLLLGLTTTSATLIDAVPQSMVDRCLRCQNFEMAEAINQFEEIVKQLLVKSWSGCLITVKDFHGLMGLFIKHNLTANGISRCIKMLFADFVAKHPCPSLISASFGDARELKLHLETLSPGMLQTLVEFICFHGNVGDATERRIKKDDKQSQIEWIFEHYCDFRRGWEIWRLALLLMAHIGQSVTPSIDFSCYQIYDWRDAESLRQQVDLIKDEVSLFPSSIVQELHDKVETIFEAFNPEWIPHRALEALDRLKMQVQDDLRESRHPITKKKARKGTSCDSRIDVEASCIESDVGSVQGSEMGRSRYHGRMSRRAALLSQSKKNIPAVPFDDENEVQASLGSVWCEIFCRFVLEELKRSPFDLPGAALFCCNLGRVTHHLVASTRGCAYSALTNPKLFYQDSCPRDLTSDQDDTLGVDASDEDTCIAFSLLNDDPTCSNLVEWYMAFEDIVSDDRGPNGNGEMLCRVSNDQAGNRTEKIGRFSQSLQDLQFIGMIQSSRKRKGDHIQRCVYQPFTM